MIQWHNGIDHASSEFLPSYTGSRVRSLGVIYVDMVHVKGCFSSSLFSNTVNLLTS